MARGTIAVGCDATIRIERDRNGFEVRLVDPAIAQKNDGPNSDWQDPSVEYQFETFAQVIEFLEKVGEKALPEENYSQAFDREAKDVKNGGD